MTIEPFKPGHLDEIDLQLAQTQWREYRDPLYAKTLGEHLGVTAREDGKVLACAGVISLERDVGHAWAFVARGQKMIRFRRCVQRLFEVSGKRRILASTEADFPQGCRWLELLGFSRLDTPATFHGPDGRAHVIYVRVS